MALFIHVHMKPGQVLLHSAQGKLSQPKSRGQGLHRASVCSLSFGGSKRLDTQELTGTPDHNHLTGAPAPDKIALWPRRRPQTQGRSKTVSTPETQRKAHQGHTSALPLPPSARKSLLGRSARSPGRRTVHQQPRLARCSPVGRTASGPATATASSASPAAGGVRLPRGACLRVALPPPRPAAHCRSPTSSRST